MPEAALLEALCNPGMYPESTTRVEVRETHISVVFLTNHYAYKLKKAVHLGFLDYSTLQQRRFYCLQELILNRRLSPDIYLDVVAIHHAGQRYTFDRVGPAVEYAVKMRRLPADRTLEACLEQGTVTLQMLGELARLLVTFHTTHHPPAASKRYGTRSQVRADWHENFAQTTNCIGSTLSQQTYDHIQQAVTTFMQRHPEWFAQRLQAGHIRDCHGDLRAEHIYFLDDNQIRIIDCIEFNKRFRYIDVVSEVAFLAMDLERLGFPTQAHQFVRAYVQYSKDVWLYRLLDFYACYRAYVRGKVASMRLHAALAPQERYGVQRQAEQCFRLARRAAARLTRPLLLITTGLIGSGKTKLAEGLTAALALQAFSSDRVRKLEAGLLPETPQRVAYGAGIYTFAASRRTYERLAELASQALAQGQSVILDASFAHQVERQRMAKLAGATGADFFILECLAPEAVIRQRLQARARAPGTISDGRWEIFRSFQRHYEPVQEVKPASHICLDTTQSIQTCVQQALAAIQEGRP
jgi:aminoglycoside phosphotransferase family enzyme/predicted kinase